MQAGHPMMKSRQDAHALKRYSYVVSDSVYKSDSTEMIAGGSGRKDIRSDDDSNSRITEATQKT